MKIYIAHLRDGLAPEVRELGESLNAVFVDVSDDKFGYYRMLRGAWRAGETFINLEEDVLPKLAQLNELWQCPSDGVRSNTSIRICWSPVSRYT